LLSLTTGTHYVYDDDDGGGGDYTDWFEFFLFIPNVCYI